METYARERVKTLKNAIHIDVHQVSLTTPQLVHVIQYDASLHILLLSLISVKWNACEFREYTYLQHTLYIVQNGVCGVIGVCVIRAVREDRDNAAGTASVERSAKISSLLCTSMKSVMLISLVVSVNHTHVVSCL